MTNRNIHIQDWPTRICMQKLTYRNGDLGQNNLSSPIHPSTYEDRGKEDNLLSDAFLQKFDSLRLKIELNILRIAKNVSYMRNE